jgi:hypothetical protein
MMMYQSGMKKQQNLYISWRSKKRRASEGTLWRCSQLLHYAVVNNNQHWARVVGFGLFFLSIQPDFQRARD